MPEKSIIIVGAGIAGLSAGCYGRVNGFRTRIFEMHKKKPGGLCTAWKRQGYSVDGCIHWLVGSGPKSGFYRIWQELGAIEGRQFVDFDEYRRIEGADGSSFILYTDLDRLERHMKELSPQDAPLTEEFIAAVRTCARFEPPLQKAPELSSLFDFLKLILTRFPLLGVLYKWNRISLAEYAGRFRHPLIALGIKTFFLSEFPVTFMLMTLAWMHNRTAGYPVGGSLEFARAIEKRYLSLGGEMSYQSRVVKILTGDGRVSGIRLEDGTEHHADYVISAADGHATIFEMLGGNYVDDTIRRYYEKLIPFPSLVYIALGVNRTFPDITPASMGRIIPVPDPFNVGGVKHDVLHVHFYNFDPGLAPHGRTLLTVILNTDYAYWQTLRADDVRYRAEKERICNAVVSVLNGRFPGLASQVEMRDVATPTTFVRYTGNWNGSVEGWEVTPETWSYGRVMRKTLPGLDNFCMAGQWVEPGGGLPAVAMSGRNAIQIICKMEKRKFRTER